MNRTIPLAKRSKKEQKAFHNSRRGSWSGLCPVNRIIPSGKVYRRERSWESARD